LDFWQIVCGVFAKWIMMWLHCELPRLESVESVESGYRKFII